MHLLQITAVGRTLEEAEGAIIDGQDALSAEPTARHIQRKRQFTDGGDGRWFTVISRELDLESRNG